jgi:hypothetical protein
MEEIELLKPDFIINVGDLIEGYLDDPDSIQAEWDEVLSVLDGTGIPYYLVPGNHDIWDDQSEEIYRERVGEPYVSFDHENTHFVILDNSRLNSWDDIDEEQLNWLESDLDRNQDAENVLVFFHKPFWAEALENDGSDRLHEVFTEKGVDRVYTGHWHHYFHSNWDGIPYTEVGSSGGGMGVESDDEGYFYHYMFVTVEGEEVNAALIRKGNTLPDDFVTFEENQFFRQVRRELVGMEGLPFTEGDPSVKGKVFLGISSPEDAGSQGQISWETLETAWSISPGSYEFDVNPGEEQTFEFEAELEDPASIYPLPLYQVDYTCRGKTIKVYEPLLLSRTATCPRVETAPSIDGSLEKEIWGKGEPITRYSNWYGEPSSAEETEIRFAHDDTYFYIGVRCKESRPEEMRNETEEWDGAVYYDDNLWFFFDTNHDEDTYYQLIVNPRGTVFDRACHMEDGRSVRDITWNGEWEIASGEDGDFWILEISVPKESLGASGQKEFGFNVRRLQYSTDDVNVYQIPFAHDPTTFGLLILQ